MNIESSYMKPHDAESRVAADGVLSLSLLHCQGLDLCRRRYDSCELSCQADLTLYDSHGRDVWTVWTDVNQLPV